jgi:DNA-binding response OmpR family regulator
MNEGQSEAAMVDILIVGSDRPMTEQVEDVLAGEGMRVVTVKPENALSWLDGERTDIVILDMDGEDDDRYDLAQSIRLRCTAPLLVLTADGRSTTLARGLEMGGDAYLVKPISVRILLAQVYALARRTGLVRQGNAGQLEVEGLVIDLHKREVNVNGRPVNLTPTECKILSCLVWNSGRALSYRSLVRQVQGYDCRQLEAKEILKVHIHNLRRKIEPQPERPRFIRTVWGFGYIFERRRYDREELDRTLSDTAQEARTEKARAASCKKPESAHELADRMPDPSKNTP